MAKENIFAGLAEELRNVMGEFQAEVYKNTRAGVNEAASFMKDKMIAATPVDTGETKDGWAVTDYQKGTVQFVGNTKTVKIGGRDAPILNFLEYSPKPRGRPFVRKTFDANKEQALDIIKGKLQ